MFALSIARATSKERESSIAVMPGNSNEQRLLGRDGEAMYGAVDERSPEPSATRERKRAATKSQKARSGEIFGTAFSLANTIMGAGILCLPSTFAADGLFGGALLVLCVWAIAIATTHFLLRALEVTGAQSFGELGLIIWGRSGALAVDLSLFILNFGICVACEWGVCGGSGCGGIEWGEVGCDGFTPRPG